MIQCIFIMGNLGEMAKQRVRGGIPDLIAILEVGERLRICLERIFTTGLAPEVYSRYSYQKILTKPGDQKRLRF